VLQLQAVSQKASAASYPQFAKSLTTTQLEPSYTFRPGPSLSLIPCTLCLIKGLIIA